MTGEAGPTALTTLLGHKGDLMLVHFRRSFDDLQAAQLAVARGALAPFLEPTTSYVSVVELGMYEMTAQIHARLAGKGLTAGSAEFEAAFDAEMAEQRGRVKGRLYLEVPAPPLRVLLPHEQAARGDAKNWYAVPVEERGADDARPRRDRPPLRGRGHPDHLRLHRLRRLGVGRRPLRRRPAWSSRS